jgi:hypothetical protein
MNSSFDSPPHAQHHLLRVSISRRRCYTCLTSTQPLASMRAVNVQHSLLIASNKIAVRCSFNPYKHQACIEADVLITHVVFKLHISMSCLIRSDVFPPQYESTSVALLNTV